MLLERYLDEVEYMWKERYFALSVAYCGKIDISVISHAFRILAESHPVLRGKLAKDDIGYLVRVSKDDKLDFVVISGGVSDLLDRLHYKKFPLPSLSRLLIAAEDGVGTLTIQFNHAIFDGPAAQLLMNELWHLYSKMKAGEDVAVAGEKTLPAPPTKLMHEIWSESDIASMKRYSRTRSGSEGNQRRNESIKNIFRRTRLTSDATDGVVLAARMGGISIHGLLCATFLIALRGDLNPYTKKKMACYSSVNGKARLTPPIRATDTTYGYTFCRAILEVSTDSDPITLGKEIKRQIDIDIASRLDNNVKVSRSTPVLDDPIDTRNIVGVGNAGAIQELSHPADVNIEDIYLYSEAICNESVPLVHPGFVVHTYNGRLSIQASFPGESFEEEEVDSIIRNIADSLSQLV